MERDILMDLSEQEKKEIIWELRGIAQEIDMEFEHMLEYNKVSRKRIERLETHLNNILGLIVMYQSVISTMET